MDLSDEGLGLLGVCNNGITGPPEDLREVLGSLALPTSAVRRLAKAGAPEQRFGSETIAGLNRVAQAFVLFATDRALAEQRAEAEKAKRQRGKAAPPVKRTLGGEHVMKFLQAELPQVAQKLASLFPDLVPNDFKPPGVRLLEQLQEQRKAERRAWEPEELVQASRSTDATGGSSEGTEGISLGKRARDASAAEPQAKKSRNERGADRPQKGAVGSLAAPLGRFFGAAVKATPTAHAAGAAGRADAGRAGEAEARHFRDDVDDAQPRDDFFDAPTVVSPEDPLYGDFAQHNAIREDFLPPMPEEFPEQQDEALGSPPPTPAVQASTSTEEAAPQSPEPVAQDAARRDAPPMPSPSPLRPASQAAFLSPTRPESQAPPPSADASDASQRTLFFPPRSWQAPTPTRPAAPADPAAALAEEEDAVEEFSQRTTYFPGPGSQAAATSQRQEAEEAETITAAWDAVPLSQADTQPASLPSSLPTSEGAWIEAIAAQLEADPLPLTARSLVEASPPTTQLFEES